MTINYNSMNASDYPDYPWSDEKKRQFVWEEIRDITQRTGTNRGTYVLYTVKEGDDDYSPIYLSKSDQRVILQDFAIEQKIALCINDDHDERRNEYDFEILEPERRRKSAYSRSIRSLADLVKNIELRNRVMELIITAFGVYDAREITATQGVGDVVHEGKDELLLLMDELGLTETDWESLKQQTHRTIGNRNIEVLFRGDSAKILADAIYGRSSLIKIKALEQIASIIKDLMGMQQLNDFFIQLGVPSSLLISNQGSKKELVYNVIVALSSTGEEADNVLLFRILEEVTHPLNFAGDTTRANEAQMSITKVLRYDGLSLIGGKMHSFAEQDRLALEKFELDRPAIDLDAFVGLGNAFGRTTHKQTPRKAEPPRPNAEEKTVPEMHFHLHNDNKNIQNVQAIPSGTALQGSSGENNAGTSNQSQGLCPDLKWEQIEIKFDNGHDVTITYGGKTTRTSYEKMGFEDSKKRLPNIQWEILRHMSEHERFIRFDDSTHLTNDLKSQKKELSQKLQSYFGISVDPIQYISSEVGKGYLAIFAIHPEGEPPKTFLGSTR